jgi:hypothetical protein
MVRAYDRQITSAADIRAVGNVRADEAAFNEGRTMRLAKKAGDRARRIQAYRLEILGRRG